MSLAKKTVQKPVTTVHFEGFSRSLGRSSPILWCWPPHTGLEGRGSPLQLAHMKPTCSAFFEHNLEALKRGEKYFRVAPMSQHSNADSTVTWFRASLAGDPGALLPNPKSCKMASWWEPVQICSSDLHLIIYHKSVINTKLALPFLILFSHHKFANRFLKMAWSYAPNGSPNFVGLYYC